MKLNKVNKEELVINLIKDDLKIVYLTAGLDRLGLNAESYRLQLSEVFFRLMGFNGSGQDEKLYEQYFNRARKVLNINIHKQPKRFDRMIHEIYNWLKDEKENCKKKKNGEK